MTQNDASALVDAAYRRLGFPGFVSVQVGEFTALPHGSITPQTIREGTIIMLDDGCQVEGYTSDITRTFVSASFFRSSWAVRDGTSCTIWIACA